MNDDYDDGVDVRMRNHIVGAISRSGFFVHGKEAAWATG